MNQNKLLTLFLDILLQALILAFICSLEVLFLKGTRSFLKTDIWIICLVYFFLHRSKASSFVFILLSSLVLSSYSVTPLYQILLALSTTALIVYTIKNSSYTPGNPYFSLMALISVFSFYLSLFILSLIFDNIPVYWLDSISWITSSLITPAFVFILKPLLVAKDKLIRFSYPFGFEV